LFENTNIRFHCPSVHSKGLAEQRAVVLPELRMAVPLLMLNAWQNRGKRYYAKYEGIKYWIAIILEEARAKATSEYLQPLDLDRVSRDERGAVLRATKL
jgi:hypothetical protein